MPPWRGLQPAASRLISTLVWEAPGRVQARQITPKDMLTGRQQEIHADRDRESGGGEATTAHSPPVGRVKKPRRQSPGGSDG